MTHHPHTHPAFLSAGIPRDTLVMQDTKPMLQNGMITGYPNNPGGGGPCYTGNLQQLIREIWEIKIFKQFHVENFSLNEFIYPLTTAATIKR